MRIIIEVDGAAPEIVLRSSGALTSNTAAPNGAPDVAGAIDAGAAPAAAGLGATAPVTAPSATAPFDPGNSFSAGAAPAFTTEG